MNYQTFEPAADLKRFIRCYWSLDADAGVRDRVFPDGCLELIFHYGDLYRKHTGASQSHLQPRSFIHGQLEKYIDLEPTGRVGIFSARFNPAGLRPFVNFPINRITNFTISVEQAWPEQGQQLSEQIINAVETSQRIQILENFLKQNLDSARLPPTEVEYCLNEITKKNGLLFLEPLISNAKVSGRTLERKFNEAVGLTPKVFARIIRFNYALQLIEKSDFNGFTAVAHDSGFYDQAHFIKDFKTITGLNPKKYFSGNLEMVRFFNL